MVLSYGADVDEGETQQVGDESTLSDSPSSNPSDDIGSIELTADSFGKLRLDQRAYLRIGEGDAVVTVDGRLPARGPGKGGIGLKLYGLYLKESFGDTFLGGDSAHRDCSFIGVS